jgi:hypothetical protein
LFSHPSKQTGGAGCGKEREKITLEAWISIFMFHPQMNKHSGRSKTAPHQKKKKRKGEPACFQTPLGIIPLKIISQQRALVFSTVAPHINTLLPLSSGEGGGQEKTRMANKKRQNTKKERKAGKEGSSRKGNQKEI